MAFENEEGAIVTINLSDTTSGTGTPTPTVLQYADSVELTVADDNENKFSVVKAKALEMTFGAEAAATLATFVQSTDNKWLVECLIGTNQIFSGYLVSQVNHESFLPVSHKYPVRLIASDNLGLLKDIPMTKPDGTNPRGRNRWADYVAWCLKYTLLNLPINVVYNLKPEGFGVNDATFDQVYLQSKTWEEQEQNVSLNPYEILQRLLKGCRLFQENNEWWIVRVDELSGSTLKYYQFDTDGVLLGNSTISALKDIGKNESIKLIYKDAQVATEPPVQLDKLTQKYETPKEIFDNQDFSRGTIWVSPFVVDISYYLRTYANLGAFPVNGQFDLVYKATDTGFFYKWTGVTYLQITGAEAPQGLGYVIDDWTLERQSGAINISAHVIKIKQFGDEKARYVELTAGLSLHWIRSSRIPLGRLDKFTFSVDRRINFKATGSGQTTDFFAQIRLYGEDGTYWTVTNYTFGSDLPGTWVQSNSTFNTNPRYIAAQYVRNNVDTSSWMTVTLDANPLPVNGEIEVLLLQHTIHGTAYLTHFANLQFEYSPYIANTYEHYTGQYNKVTQVLDTKNKLEETVYVGDLPKPLFKGRMELKTAGGQYYGVTGWFDENLGTGGGLGIAPFGKYQVFEWWNQNRREMRVLQGSLKGLDSTTEIPGLLHQYTFTATSSHTTNKKFILLSYSQDLDTCKWTGVFAEVYDSVEGKVYNSDHLFKYTSGNDE